MKLTFLLLLPLLLAATVAPAAPKLAYLLSMDEPHTHYFAVEMRLTDLDRRDYLDVKMATWTPGSYLIREYAKNVEAFVATDGKGAPLRSEKVSKNTWRVYLRNAPELRVTYRLYANELTVRTSYVDASHGYVNGASMFMYPDQMQQLPSTLTIRPFAGWTAVSTALDSVPGEKFTFSVPSYDTLVDSPIEIGTHPTLNFVAAGVPHRVAMFGAANYEPTRLLSDMKKICEEATKVVGEHPCKNYLFLVHNLAAGGGGLEHLNSTSLQTSRAGYATEAGYNGFLGLVAHEYFHLWNVKRLRPLELGPFDYEREVYPKSLWISEGVTDYYADLQLARAGLYTPDEYLRELSAAIRTLQTTPGRLNQSAETASFDAWIKQYRPDDNTVNSTISYYTKGAVLGFVLDARIRAVTSDAKSLDDVMRLAFTRYSSARGFTPDDFRKTASEVAGTDLGAWFVRALESTEELDYDPALDWFGLRLSSSPGSIKEAGWLGAKTKIEAGRLLVENVPRGTPAYGAGVNPGDEILGIDDFRVLPEDLTRRLAAYRPGRKVVLLVSRRDELTRLDVTLGEEPPDRFTLQVRPDLTPEQRGRLRRWMVGG